MRDDQDGRGAGRCLVCGARLGARGPYFIVNHPDGVHAACRDWAGEPFPFDGDLERMRHAARALRIAGREVEHHGRWLVRVRALWPTDAREAASSWHERKARLVYRLVRLRDRLDL
ncbi:MAG: hypothetical protein AAGN82_16350 [Myxococcota bacterium]